MKFIDETRIRASAGDGGPGAVSFYRAKFVRRGPADGGNGGHGGDVVAIADPQLSTLLDLRYRKEWKANPGKRGGDADCDGRRGDDCIIKVPVGTLIRDVVTLRVSIKPEDVKWLTESKFEIGLYIDGIFLVEDEEGSNPYNYRLNTKMLNNGAHAITVNVTAYTGEMGSQSLLLETRNE